MPGERIAEDAATPMLVLTAQRGRFAEARDAIDGVRRRIADYAGTDPELRGIVAELREEAPVFAAAMPEMARKERHFASYNVQSSRDVQGRSIRR